MGQIQIRLFADPQGAAGVRVVAGERRIRDRQAIRIYGPKAAALAGPAGHGVAGEGRSLDEGGPDIFEREACASGSTRVTAVAPHLALARVIAVLREQSSGVSGAHPMAAETSSTRSTSKTSA